MPLAISVRINAEARASTGRATLWRATRSAAIRSPSRVLYFTETAPCPNTAAYVQWLGTLSAHWYVPVLRHHGPSDLLYNGLQGALFDHNPGVGNTAFSDGHVKAMTFDAFRNDPSNPNCLNLQ